MLKMFWSVFRPKPSRFVKDVQFTVADEETKQKIFTFNKLTSENTDTQSSCRLIYWLTTKWLIVAALLVTTQRCCCFVVVVVVFCGI